MIEIPIEIVSLNVLRRRYKHPHAYRRLRNRYGWALKASRAEHRLGRAAGRRRVHIVRLMGPRGKEFDPDNLHGGAKPLVDELVTVGVLLDDTAAAAEITYDQERATTFGTRIEVYDAGLPEAA